MKEQKQQKILVIGGVASGATAAARARRLDEQAEITLLERGSYVSFANCGLPYFVSRDISKRSSLLLQTPEGFFGRYRVNVRLHSEVVEIDRERRCVIAMEFGERKEFMYDKLILAQGGNPIMPALPGVELEHVFQMWTIPHMDRVHKWIEDRKPENAVVAGGGFIGLEMAEALCARGLRVTVVELASQLLVAMDPEFGAMTKDVLVKKNIEVVTGSGLAQIRKNEVVLTDGRVLPAGLVLMSVGVHPELALSKKAGLAVGTTGGLLVDEYLQTSDPHIYAAGDMVEILHRVHNRKVRMPLAGPANRQGRNAATNALGGRQAYRGVFGTAVVKLFEHTAAFTGLSEKTARDAGFDVGVSFVFKDHHASYYPGSKMLALKLVYQVPDGLLLGAQAFGEAGVDKRIDVLSTALLGKLRLEELAEIDLAYAPPYSSANDPINMAAFVGLNHLNGFSVLCTPAQAAIDLAMGSGIVLDVRTIGEQSKANLLFDRVLSMPADELRDRIGEVPQGVPIYLLSKDGFLGHLAYRILQSNGFSNIYNIAGGYAAARWFPQWRFITPQ